MTENTTPKVKSRSKIKPLEEKIQDLEYELEQKQEKLYEAGLETRPTIMSQIEDREKATLDHILFCIKECERETGRDLRGQNCALRQYIKNI